MPHKKEMIAGDIYGRLIVVKELDRLPHAKYRRRILCKCTCEEKNEAIVDPSSLITGRTQSCGCLHKEIVAATFTTHGLTKHPLYSKWYGMFRRCYNKNNKQYKYYGGRGIKMCKEWKSKKGYKGLKNFIEWNNSLPVEKQWKKGLEIDRINNNKGYYSWNCRFVTDLENTLNKRDIRWITIDKTKYKIFDLYDKNKAKIKYRVFRERILKGWSVEKALNTKLNPRHILVKDKNNYITIQEYYNKYCGYGVSMSMVYERIKKGWRPIKAVTFPNRYRPKKRLIRFKRSKLFRGGQDLL